MVVGPKKSQIMLVEPTKQRLGGYLQDKWSEFLTRCSTTAGAAGTLCGRMRCDDLLKKINCTSLWFSSAYTASKVINIFMKLIENLTVHQPRTLTISVVNFFRVA
jgi:hypothetical protein